MSKEFEKYIQKKVEQKFSEKFWFLPEPDTFILICCFTIWVFTLFLMLYYFYQK